MVARGIIELFNVCMRVHACSWLSTGDEVAPNLSIEKYILK